MRNKEKKWSTVREVAERFGLKISLIDQNKAGDLILETKPLGLSSEILRFIHY